MKPAKEIATALKAWLEWGDAGAPEGHPVFDRASGLCAVTVRHVAQMQGAPDDAHTLTRYLRLHLGVITAPFSHTQRPHARFEPPAIRLYGAYVREARRNVMHTNPLRITFARALVALYDGGPPPTGQAVARGRSPCPDGGQGVFWTYPVKVRANGMRPQAWFNGRWRSVRPLPKWGFGFTVGGQVVTITGLKFDRGDLS